MDLNADVCFFFFFFFFRRNEYLNSKVGRLAEGIEE